MFSSHLLLFLTEVDLYSKENKIAHSLLYTMMLCQVRNAALIAFKKKTLFYLTLYVTQCTLWIHYVALDRGGRVYEFC